MSATRQRWSSASQRASHSPSQWQLAAIGAGLGSELGRQVGREGLEPPRGPAHVIAHLVKAEGFGDIGHGVIPRAEHQPALGGAAPLHGCEEIAIERDLKQVLGARAAGELGVPGLIGPSPARTGARHAHEEVGEADPGSVGQCRLVNERRAARHGLHGRRHSRRPCAVGNPDDIAAALAQAREAGRLVLASFARDELAVRILHRCGCRPEAAAGFDLPGRRGATAQERRRERRGQALYRAAGVHGFA